MGAGLTVNLVGVDGVHCKEGNGQCGNVGICNKYLLQYKLDEKCIGCMGLWLISDQEFKTPQGNASRNWMALVATTG